MSAAAESSVDGGSPWSRSKPTSVCTLREPNAPSAAESLKSRKMTQSPACPMIPRPRFAEARVRR